MTDFMKKIVDRQATREGAGTYTLECGHQIAVTGGDWKPIRIRWFGTKAEFPCHECKRNAEHEAAK